MKAPAGRHPLAEHHAPQRVTPVARGLDVDVLAEIAPADVVHALVETDDALAAVGPDWVDPFHCDVGNVPCMADVVDIMVRKEAKFSESKTRNYASSTTVKCWTYSCKRI